MMLETEILSAFQRVRTPPEFSLKAIDIHFIEEQLGQSEWKEKESGFLILVSYRHSIEIPLFFKRRRNILIFKGVLIPLQFYETNSNMMFG